MLKKQTFKQTSKRTKKKKKKAKRWLLSNVYGPATFVKLIFSIRCSAVILVETETSKPGY